MELNYIAIGIATVLQFIFGAVWYTFIFGKTWRDIHGFDNLSKEDQQKAQKEMVPFLVIQFIATVVTTFVFALLQAGFPSEWNIFGEAGFFWLGFIVPTQISAVMFGGTKKEWMVKKTLIMAVASLICLEIIASVLHFM